MQMGTLPNVASTIGNLQTPITNSVQVQGPIGPIIQDRDRIEASQTRVTSNQHSSVYIGQVVKRQKCRIHFDKYFIFQKRHRQHFNYKYFRINLLITRSMGHLISIQKSLICR